MTDTSDTTTTDAPGASLPDPGAKRAGLTLGDRTFRSRLIIGTGKYDSPETMKRVLEASGAEIITVAVRRVDLDAENEESLLHHLDPEKVLILPNTAGCYSAEEAIRVARLGRAAGLSDFVKLEVIGDERTLYPDVVELLEATETLAGEGFTVLPYTSDDPIVARRLVDAGAAAVMPLASPIGSGLGVVDPLGVRFVMDAVDVPVIVDAGVGTASDAAITMELGVDGILMNTAIAKAKDPVTMARAMRLAVEAGRAAFEAGRMERKTWASPSSPTEGRVGS
ncbi:MAG: thiazole synthase [Gemmatimonadota bacterium]|nr:thiazole synthase [Gemmatimonadota bacterium]